MKIEIWSSSQKQNQFTVSKLISTRQIEKYDIQYFFTIIFYQYNYILIFILYYIVIYNWYILIIDIYWYIDWSIYETVKHL